MKKMIKPPCSLQRARSSKDRAPVRLTGRCEFENNSKVSPRSHIANNTHNNEKEENQAHSLNKTQIRLTGISHEFELNSKYRRARTLRNKEDNNYLKLSIKEDKESLPSWYAINLAISFLNSGSLLASLISFITLLKGFVFIDIFKQNQYLNFSEWGEFQLLNQEKQQT